MNLDKIIEIAGKVQLVTNIVAPGFGGAAGLGVTLVKFFAAQWNQAHADEPIELPPDAELIARLAATATRIVDTGTTFLSGGLDEA